MQFFAACSRAAAQVESLFHEFPSAFLGAPIILVVPHKSFDLRGKETADGSSALGCEHVRFPQGCSRQTDGHVLPGWPLRGFHRTSNSHNFTGLGILPVADRRH